MMKKILAWILIISMLGVIPAAYAQENTALAEEKEVVIDPALQEHLTVGGMTPLRGDFFLGAWSKSTSDMDVRALLHGYNLIYWDGAEGLFRANPAAVRQVTVTENAAGDRTYTFELMNGLTYNNGTPITARDYGFSVLLRISRELEQIGGVRENMEYLVGSAAYRNGTQAELRGVRVPNDNTISFTLAHEYLPFFYEMGLMSCNPYPISVIAPGVQVADDGLGIQLTNIDVQAVQPVFTAELLRQTILDERTGYLTHPGVTSGTYTLTSFDGVTAEFVINPNFTGNEKGEQPVIRTLTYTLTDNEGVIGALESGELDIANKVTNVNTAMSGITLAQDGEYRMANYPRSGLAYVSFCCEKPEMASAAVRQAIAWCMDRDAITAAYTGNLGQRVDGFYGVGQWMYSVVNGTVETPITPPENATDAAAMKKYEDDLKAWEELSLDNLTEYTLDLDAAKQLLDNDGWRLTEDGVRQKTINGVPVRLELTMYCPDSTTIGDVMEEYFVPNLEKAGIRLTIERVSAEELFAEAYTEGERKADMFFMASNFDELFDPASYFTAENGRPGWSVTNLSDARLYNLAAAMRSTKPGDVLAYEQKWIAFEERFNEILPMIPIYSNVYFDFYRGDLQNYKIAENSSWSRAIIPAYIGEDEAGLNEADEIETAPVNGARIG